METFRTIYEALDVLFTLLEITSQNVAELNYQSGFVCPKNIHVGYVFNLIVEMSKAKNL